MKDRKPLRAVVCDDAEDVRELVAELLRFYGHQVTVAADGPAAVRAIVDEHPDVALIDITLPGMNGYEVAREVRTALGPALRLVAMTGYGRDEDRAEAFAAGFDAHLTKPASAQVILDALQA